MQKLSRWILLVELAGGAALGMALAVAGGFIGPRLGPEATEGLADLGRAVLGMGLGYGIGVPLGVALAGAFMGERGAFWLALLGSLLGLVFVVVSLSVLLDFIPGGRQYGLLPLFLFAPLALAVIGFNLRRR